MSLLQIFQWCENSAISEMIRNSRWMFPLIEAFHLVGLGLTGGTVLVVDLRLLGFGFRNQPVTQIAKDAEPWLLGSMTMMFLSGIPLFMSEAIKCYNSFPFWVKMASLFLAILFTFTLQRRVIMKEDSSWGKVAAIISLILWAGVAWGGRWIGFS